MRKALRFAAAILPLMFLFPISVFAQDAANCGENCKVVLDNEHVRVLDYHVKPGGKIPMHSHPGHVTYFVTAGKMKTTMADGKVTEGEPKAGEARWSDALSHANENTGTEETHAIVIEIKEKKQ